MKVNLNLVLLAGLALGGYYAFKRLDAKTDINRGTAFEGTGAIGTLGNITDKASGGILSRFGRAVGDLLDPVNSKTLDELTGTNAAKVSASDGNGSVGFGGVF